MARELSVVTLTTLLCELGESLGTIVRLLMDFHHTANQRQQTATLHVPVSTKYCWQSYLHL